MLRTIVSPAFWMPLAMAALMGPGCEGGNFSYRQGDPAKMRSFLEEQNILRLNPDGSVNDKQTILALVEWSRLNMAHVADWSDESRGKDKTQDEANSESTDVMTLLENQRPNGYVTVHGCWGATSVFEQLLGSANIEVVRDVLHLSDGAHSRADFPALDRTSLHMDDVYMTKKARWFGRDIPAISLLAPLTILDAYLDGEEDGHAPQRKWKNFLAEKYLPDVYLEMRSLLALVGANSPGQAYGTYPSPEDVKTADEAGAGGAYAITDERVLRLMDEEIDRLGGPQAALDYFNVAIDRSVPPTDDVSRRGKRNDYLPLPPQVVFAESE